jgi:hypothetical protein
MIKVELCVLPRQQLWAFSEKLNNRQIYFSGFIFDTGAAAVAQIIKRSNERISFNNQFQESSEEILHSF